MTTDQGPYPVQYPVQFAVEYPDRPLNRLTSFFRIFVIIPIWIVLGTVSGATWEWAGGHSSMAYGGAGAGGLLFLGPLLMILFRQKSPGGGSTGTWNCSGSSTGCGPTWSW